MYMIVGKMIYVGYQTCLCGQRLGESEHSEIGLSNHCCMRISCWNLYRDPRYWSLISRRNPNELGYLIWLILPVVIRLS